MTEKPAKQAANDNACPRCRKAVVAIPSDMPVTEHELALIETYFGTMIAELLKDAANDNAPQTAPDQRSEP